jgi:hypothetical protein
MENCLLKTEKLPTENCQLFPPKNQIGKLSNKNS